MIIYFKNINLRVLGVLCGLFLFSFNLNAADIPHEFTDSQQEARYKQLLEELRCLVCQNQSLADSHADLAQDFRDEIYKMIKQGKTNAQIVDYLVTRYGDFVLYNPPLKSRTVVLWFGPFALLLIAVLVAVLIVRRRQQAITVPLSDKEQQELDQLLQRSSKRD